jgi:peptide-methionine (R)-S-oxide reductase
MKNILLPFCCLFIGHGFSSCAQQPEKNTQAVSSGSVEKTLVFDGKVIEKSDAEWKQELEPFQYQVLRKQATERAFTGELNNNKETGIYYCSGCGLALFSSETKFDSGTGWPSFYEPIDKNNIGETTDYDIGDPRTEVHCARCGGHLGHVFDDAYDQPGGLRYCINSVSLEFEKK